MEFAKLEPVEYGWSGDKKYRAWDPEGRCYFLRICPLAREEKLRQAFFFQKQAAENGLPVSRPLELSKEGDQLLWVEEWLPGDMAEQVLPSLTQNEQYRLGLQGGEIAKHLHDLPCSPPLTPWEERFGEKIDRKIKMYRSCPLQYEKGDLFISYLLENRHLLQGRPQCCQHGDFHVGNMMIQKGKLYVIDFDRPDFGDPWEEFNRIVWCAQLSPAFASGMVDGYFEGNPPLEFWKLLALYISNNALGSLPWAIPFGDQEIATMRKQAAEVLEWYDYMRNPVPTWYQSIN
ncbi:aminoglycoside phosphotransferase Aph [Clostridium sp. CAG:1013]|nr:aminoglycoside phosphotransferase Aph [Clostridium sp. CAG:1013]